MVVAVAVAWPWCHKGFHVLNSARRSVTTRTRLEGVPPLQSYLLLKFLCAIARGF